MSSDRISAKKSCEEAIKFEKKFSLSEENTGAETINKGASYDMGWQKWGKATITLQVIVVTCTVTAYISLPELRL